MSNMEDARSRISAAQRPAQQAGLVTRRNPPPTEAWVSHLWQYLSGESAGVGGGGDAALSKVKKGAASGRGGGNGSVGLERLRGPASAGEVAQRHAHFARGWPLLPCLKGGPGMRVLRPLVPRGGGGGGGGGGSAGQLGVVTPRRLGSGWEGPDALPAAVAACLARVGVAVVDGSLLGAGPCASQAVHRYAEPPTARGVLRALFAGSHTPAPGASAGSAGAAGVGAAASLGLRLGFGLGLGLGAGGAAVVGEEEVARMEVRFKGVGAAGRDALRNFLRDPTSFADETASMMQPGSSGQAVGGRGSGGGLVGFGGGKAQASASGSGRVPLDLVPYIRALPIFPVFGPGEAYHTLLTPSSVSSTSLAQPSSGGGGGGGGRAKGCSDDHGSGGDAVGPAAKWLPPDEDLSEGMLSDAFVRCAGDRDRAFLEQLGVGRCSLAALFLYHLVPRLDPDAFLARHDAAVAAAFLLDLTDAHLADFRC